MEDDIFQKLIMIGPTLDADNAVAEDAEQRIMLASK